MSNKNTNLHKAKNTKNDEYYTRIADIERELKHYRNHFKDAVVFCNCDDPTYSNFWKYFHLNFEYLGLKKLITTHYHRSEPTYMMVYEGGCDNDISVGTVTPLKQNGDFRSPESIALLQEATIVVTNPPFSLFREYFAQLIEYNKKFIILSNPNALHYKEIFPYVMDNKVWLGYKSMSSDMLFDVSEEFAKELVATKKQGSGYKIIDGVVKGRAQAIWLTNLDISKRHEFLDLIEKYSPDAYPHYDNYDAIEVGKVINIPCDYFGAMGVPDSFLDYYSPDQFEILGCTQRGCHDRFLDTKKYNDYREMRQTGEKTGSSGVKTNENANLAKNDGKHNYYINDDGHIVQSTFSRVFIKRKDVTGNEN